MAKESPKDEDDAKEGEGAPAKGRFAALKAIPAKIFGNKKILIGVVAAFILIIGGVSYMMFAGGHEEPAPEAEKPHATSADATEMPVDNLPQFVDLPEMTVNLADASTGKQQYLRVRITLEIADKPTVDKIQPMMPRILDIFQVYLRELRAEDIAGSSGIQRLKEELTKRVNQSVSPSQITGVLFKEMLVQ